MDKYLCERCGKELVFRCAYSKIDHKLICAECDDKEQPKDLMKQITDLEAKLAESESESNARYTAWQEEIGECDRLRLALAEKEQVIVEQKIRIRALSEENFLLKDDVQMAIKMQNKHDMEKNQTAIAKLEKVKKEIDYQMAIREGDLSQQCEDVCISMSDYIDQQIKSLKGEK